MIRQLLNKLFSAAQALEKSRINYFSSGLSVRNLGAVLIIISSLASSSFPMIPHASAANAAPTATLTWAMEDRFGLDRNRDGIIDYDYSHEYIHPSAGYIVHFDGCTSKPGSSPIASYMWTITFPGGNQKQVFPPASNCKLDPPSGYQPGTYSVTLTVTDKNGLSSSSSRDVRVRDILIISLGDSFGSGEGAPDIPNYCVGAACHTASWEDPRCHRSSFTGPARAALDLERSDPHTSVTFVSFACSGAGILEGLVGQYDGISPPSGTHNPLPPQTWQVAYAVCDVLPFVPQDPSCRSNSRAIDLLMISVGGNDAHFGDLIKSCAKLTTCYNSPPVQSMLNDGLTALPARYKLLDQDINKRFLASNVLITEYADPTHDKNGKYCTSLVPGITQDEVRWSYETVLTSINNAVRSAASSNQWVYVGNIASQFRAHGYCASPQNWFNTLSESFVNQGDQTGTLHPNRDGYLAYKNSILPIATSLLAQNNPPRVSNLPPIADPAGPYETDAGSSMTFDGRGSFDPDGYVASYRWDFGDGTTLQGAKCPLPGQLSNPYETWPSCNVVHHTYQVPGTYILTLRVTDNDGVGSQISTTTVNVKTSGPKYSFDDEFGGATVNSALWDTSIATGNIRWCSTTVENHLASDGTWQDTTQVPCNQQTEDGPYGTIGVANSEVSFQAPIGRAFPYIWSGPPSKTSPFATASGDFVVEIKAKFDSLGTNGAGILISNWANSNPIGNNPPAAAGNGLVTIKADNTNGLYVDFDQRYQIDGTLDYHIYKLEYKNSQCTLSVNGNVIAGPVGCNAPNNIWIGNPAFTHWTNEDWTDFRIDYIRVSDPTP